MTDAEKVSGGEHSLTEDAFAELRLADQLCFVLYAAMNDVSRLYRSALDPFGLTLPQYLALLVLWERSPRKVNEIALALKLNSGTVTPLLQRLEANGFIRRERDRKDERRVFVHLTTKGLAVRKPALHLRRQLVKRLAWSSQDIESLKGQLRRLISSLDD